MKIIVAGKYNIELIDINDKEYKLYFSVNNGVYRFFNELDDNQRRLKMQKIYSNKIQYKNTYTEEEKEYIKKQNIIISNIQNYYNNYRIFNTNSINKYYKKYITPNGDSKSFYHICG